MARSVLYYELTLSSTTHFGVCQTSKNILKWNNLHINTVVATFFTTFTMYEITDAVLQGKKKKKIHE